MFKAITANEFLTMFASEDDCNEYLFNIKWKDGYKCRKCTHTQHGKGRTPFHLRCRKCGYDESPTAGTLFHNLKFSLRKAFWLMFRMVHDKKGESTLTMGKQFGLNPKTTWRFMTRIRFAMAEDDIQFQIRKRQKEMRKLDGICISHRGANKNGFQKVNVVWQRLSKQRLALLPETRSALFTLSDSPEQSELLWGHYVKEDKDIRIWNLKTWITGTHHHCSERYLDGYIAEFIFRQNYRKRPHTIWQKLLKTFMRLTTRDQRAIAFKRENRMPKTE